MNKQAKGDVIMEFEKLKKIIAEVCDVDEDKITMDYTFKDDLDADSPLRQRCVHGREYPYLRLRAFAFRNGDYYRSEPQPTCV